MVEEVRNKKIYLIHFFRNNVSSAYYVPSVVIGPGNTAIKKNKVASIIALHPSLIS